MKCPYCKNEETKVLDSRDTEGSVTKRRRECLRCQKRFTTFERVEDINIVIVKKDSRREKFDIEKLKRGLLKACEKRPVPTEKIDELAEQIESEIRKLDTKEVQSKKIGEIAMKKLKKLDKIAYIRFASVYREFEDISSFEKELKMLK
ncbi:transcriptional repressor NrdR [Candidatus Woesearchaeota archaeon]|nr:transcriptional repressor NrdR [Candidatus Woesearchaeota archaeon]